ncbi:hypothetical protein AMTR_s00074p00016940 [Amborella trichopoda]|uniref:Uncharacterized protein n=1 Tax=Amborella trichopoda TaxID=13333 RepID=W1NQ33_AMBTC|nr:hypothetical protein AMTR_s00074p00016940 [Amborella trichopoda]
MGEEGKTIVVVDDGLIKPCFSAAMKAQREHERTTLSHFIVEKKPKSGHVIMGFAGSWRSLEADLLRSKGKFGECKVDLGIFPLLKNLCTDEPAKVNEAFLHRFSDLFLEDDRFQKKVQSPLLSKTMAVLFLSLKLQYDRVRLFWLKAFD